MTGFAIPSPAPLRRYAGSVWIALVAVILATLAAGAFALGRATHNSGSSSTTTRTVWLQSVPGSNAGSVCHVNRPC